MNAALPDDYLKKTKKFKLMFCGQPHVNAVALFDEIEEFFKILTFKSFYYE